MSSPVHWWWFRVCAALLTVYRCRMCVFVGFKWISKYRTLIFMFQCPRKDYHQVIFKIYHPTVTNQPTCWAGDPWPWYMLFSFLLFTMCHYKPKCLVWFVKNRICRPHRKKKYNRCIINAKYYVKREVLRVNLWVFYLTQYKKCLIWGA